MQLEGTIKSVTFHSPDSGFSVFRVIVKGEKSPVIVTGTFPELGTGETLQMEGEWGNHPKYGRQFKCVSFTIAETATDNITDYLASGLFRGIGQKTAEAIVKVFGEDTADILDNHPEIFRKAKIKGFTAKKTEAFLAAWQLNRHSRESLLFLYSHGITGSVAKKLWNQFRQETIAKVSENPYLLCEEVWGIGSVKADEIAMKIGIAKDSPLRLQAALLYTLQEASFNAAHYVDSIGFQQVPEFLQEQQTPVFDKLPPEQQQALSDTVQDTLQMLVDADKRIYGDVTGKTLEAIAAQGYSYKDGQLEKQQPEATPDSLLTGETVRTPRGNFHITDMSREQIEAAGFGFHHASEDGKYLIMGNGTQAYAIAAEQPQRDNPLKHVEDTIEQNDNNFDGLINNTPQTPTVADFEQRAKAGEAISVTDLAKAVKAEKREQPQKKPSILKKLDEYKKQAAQQPKDKQKEHKKDLEV